MDEVGKKTEIDLVAGNKTIMAAARKKDASDFLRFLPVI